MREKDRTLDAVQIRQFIEAGFVRLDDAFPRALADAARDHLWRDLLHTFPIRFPSDVDPATTVGMSMRASRESRASGASTSCRAAARC